MRWSALLSRPIPLNDGSFLRTLGQARDLTRQNKKDRFRDPWARAEPLIEEAARTGSADDIERVTGQMEMVVFGAAKMQLGAEALLEAEDQHLGRRAEVALPVRAVTVQLDLFGRNVQPAAGLAVKRL